MSKIFVVSGTDTNVGKTIFSAALVSAIKGYYWKPIQCGSLSKTDSEIVAQLSKVPSKHIIAENYLLSAALSPHRAAELEGVLIDYDKLKAPAVDGPLIIEGAGGIMVPITRSFLQIDLYALWKFPIILVARTTLGTINHTLLSLSALRSRNIPLHGVVFVGEENMDSQKIICEMGQTRCLGRLPLLLEINSQNLLDAFRSHFSPKDFA